jgi:hypothetical protein
VLMKWNVVILGLVNICAISSIEAQSLDGLKFADVESIALTNCAKSGCHDGERKFSLKTREDFFNRIPRPLNAINRGTMPDGNPDFRFTEDGKKLVEWLMGPETE